MKGRERGKERKREEEIGGDIKKEKGQEREAEGNSKERKYEKI